MDTRELKLQLINQIILTEDTNVLLTIQRMLNMADVSEVAIPQATELIDLQREIDHLFQTE